MAFLTESQARNAADREIVLKSQTRNQILAEAAKLERLLRYDVFLSHSKIDSGLVLGAKSILEQKGYTVYVDWLDDPELDRSRVNLTTAERLRIRMRRCKAMFYIHTTNAALSKWCPWELGYFNGLTHPKSRVFIFPILASGQTNFIGQEYLQLYPTIDIDNIGVPGKGRRDIWRRDDTDTNVFKNMDGILEGV